MRNGCDFSFFYVDDSGSETTGLTTFTFVRINPAAWAPAMQRWLAYRSRLYDRYGIPASARLHATELAGGRGNIAAHPQWRRGRDGLAVIHEGLETIAALPGVSIGTAFRHTTARQKAFEREKQDLYRCTVAMINGDLAADGQYGTLVMDGDGSNNAYARAHRRLPGDDRRLLEDPFFRHASTSQWVQIADFAAWSAYRALRGARRDKAAAWYTTVLGTADATGPVAL